MRKISLRVGIVAGCAAAVAIASLIGYGYVWGFDNPTATANTTGTQPPTTLAPSTTAAASSTSTTAAPTTTTTRPAMRNPTPQALPDVGMSGIGSGSSGPTVMAYEQRLADLHFDPGAIDGRYDASTVYAVQAVQ
ncbi:MAG TPA: peptidoglycan-binding domain-containing protein, partial [Acidimicrobiia bacterium]